MDIEIEHFGIEAELERHEKIRSSVQLEEMTCEALVEEIRVLV
jgi:hypothetical protein